MIGHPLIQIIGRGAAAVAFPNGPRHAVHPALVDRTAILVIGVAYLFFSVGAFGWQPYTGTETPWLAFG